MPKVNFSKIGLIKNISIKEYVCENDTVIEVKQYLPVEEKMEMITTIVNATLDTNVYYNYLRLEIFKKTQYLLYYTNISTTKKQLEDFLGFYNLIEGNGFIDEIIKLIPEKEKDIIDTSISETLASIYAYRNSAAGMVHSVNQEYQILEKQAEKVKEINEGIKQGGEIELLKDVLNNFS